MSLPDLMVTSVAGRTGAIVIAATDVTGLGSAATQASTAFATAAQGAKADSAVQSQATAITSSRALVATTDAGRTLVNSTANTYALLLVPGLGEVVLEQGSTGGITVALGTATTLTGATYTNVFQSRLKLIEQTPGVYHGEYCNSPLLPIQADLTTLNSAYPAASNVGRTVQVGSAAPYKTYRSNGVTWLSSSDFVDPFTTGALESTLSAISAGSSVVPVYLVPGATYVMTSNPVCDVYKTACIIGGGTLIDCTAITIGMTFDYKSSASVGTEIRKSKTRIYEGFELLGAGKTASGTAGLWVHGSVSKNSPQPSLRNIYVHEFETLIGGRDQFYLVDVLNCHFYNGTYGLWQQAGNDSGENCVMTGGLFDQCYCFVRLDDPSSEWTFNTVSFDYGRQLFVVTAQAHLTFRDCHIECRGKNLGSDNLNYIVSGTGSDTRAPFQALDTTVDGAIFTIIPLTTQSGVAVTLNVGASGAISVLNSSLANPGAGEWAAGVPTQIQRDVTNACYKIVPRTMGNIPIVVNVLGTTAVTCDAIITRDCFFDADAESEVRLFNCNFNVNASGGAGPYDYYRLAKARSAGTVIHFDKVHKENDLNWADHFWDGPGNVICGFVSRIATNPSNIVLHNRQSKYNLVANPAMQVTTIDPVTGSNVVNNLKAVLTNGDLQALRLDLYQNWWISKGRTGNQPAARFSDASNGVYGASTFTASITGSVMTVSASATGLIRVGMNIYGNGVATTTVASLGTGTGGAGTYNLDTSQTVASEDMSAAFPNGNLGISVAQPAVGGATATAWSISGEVLTITTMSGTTPFVRDMTLAGTGVTAGTKIIGPLSSATTGLTGTYLLDTTHGTVAGSGNLTGNFTNAVQIYRYNTEASGFLATSTVSFAVPISAGRIAAMKMLMLIPSTGGIAGGTVALTSKYARLSKDLDANGCPLILERFAQIRFKTWTVSAVTKDIWNETLLDAWASAAEAPPGANAYLVDIDLNTNTTPGAVLFAYPRVDHR